MDEELIVVVMEGCEACDEYVNALKKANVKFKIMDVTKDEKAKKIFNKLMIPRIPYTILRHQKYYCTLDEKGNVRCIDGGEVEGEEEGGGGGEEG